MIWKRARHSGVLMIAACLGACEGLADLPDGPHQATGIKIGEVTPTSAIVWTRGTRGKERGVPLDEIDEWMAQNRLDNFWDFDELFAPDDLEELDPSSDARDAEVESAREVQALTRRQLEQVIHLGAVYGADGDVQVTYQPVDPPGPAQSTPRMDLRNGHNFTRQFQLTGLTPNTRYRVTSRIYKKGEDDPQSEIEGSFRTAPSPDDSTRPILFTVVTGQAFRNIDQSSQELFANLEGTDEERRDKALLGHQIYPVMLAMDPDFMVNTGDVVYYDHQGPSARSERAARLWWQRMFSLPNMKHFHRRVPVYFIKDDHDTLKNDCWPGQRHGRLTYREGRAIFHEETPFPVDDDDLSINEGLPYRTVRWGKHLQVWILETRDYRSPNNMNRDNPKKTMLGDKQIDWLRETLLASDATFKMILSAVPILGPDRPEATTQEERDNLSPVIIAFRPPRWDNLSNEAWHLERTRLLTETFAGIDNVIIVCGDRHWKYHSAWPSKQDPQIQEFSSGCVSDSHAKSHLRMFGVPRPGENPLLYWRDPIEQGGFLSIEVTPGTRGSSGQPAAVFRFHRVDGSLAYPVNTAGRREVLIRADGQSSSAPVF